jgi:hypothetical protein
MPASVMYAPARSDEDLRNAEHDLTALPPFIRDALFHTQQAVEKAWKGRGTGREACPTWFHTQQAVEKACKDFLARHDRPFPKIHNLEELGSLCAAAQQAVRFRCPGEPCSPSVEEAREALVLAGRIVADILARLPGQVQPPRIRG